MSLIEMLAIVIPYFKIPFFEETLDSLARQTCKRFTVYIGNDASPDDPVELIEKYNSSIKIHFHQFSSNLGSISLTQQWARCLEMIKDEEWVMILGDDDVLSSNVVEEFYKDLESIEKSTANVVKIASQKINANGEPFSPIYTHAKVQDYKEVFYNRFFKGVRSSLSEHIFKRSILRKYNFRNMKYGWFADDLIILECSEFGKIFTINDALVSFRFSELNISRPGFLEAEKLKIRFQFFDIVVNEFLKNFDRHQKKNILKEYEKLSDETELHIPFTSFLRLYITHCGIIEGLRFVKGTVIGKVLLSIKKNKIEE